MSAARRVAKNTTVLILSNILSYAITFITTVYIARYLGVEGWGIISIALSITGIFGVLTDLGLSSLTVREVARNKSFVDKYLANTIILKIFLGFITFGVIALVSHLAGYSLEVRTVTYIITASVILGAFTNVFYSIFQAYEKMEYQSLATIISNVIMLILTLTVIYLGLGVVGYATVYVIVGIAGFIYIFLIYIKKYSLPKFGIDVDFWKEILKESLPFAISGVFVTIYFWIDSFMLSVMVGNDAVGIYNAAYRLIFVLLFIPTLFVTALFPVMSCHFESAKELLKLEYEKSFKYLFIVAIFIFVYGLAFANEIILIIFGQKFYLAITALQTLIWVVPIIFLTSLFGNIMNAINKQRLVTIVAASNAVFNVVLNLILIPKYSFIGASIATVLTELLGFILMFYYISKYHFRVSIKNSIILPVVNGALVLGLIYYFKTFNWIIAGFIGVLFYLVLLYAMKIIDKDDIKLLKEILPIGDKND
ncbi:polysaccharide biosynthesis protein [Methanobacterium sp. MZ-A1]|uniref:Polysaccharide biosynthesis protein n=1 Tax=Methanobacterium subterraneum TaxID=59277 RepID=A0A2H4VEF0_9EURY|nr:MULTISPECIES: flippase [Methanobacterium]AUB56464.1 polysaccharide biosynthesis protein [Methanobacterium subterraneum]AUB58666.1 polysaccharide biosynthesis protein [Methanobacterium sp. MZ-A1]MBW4257360.1 flippase [Methanobacterium sp. YSL]